MRHASGDGFQGEAVTVIEPIEVAKLVRKHTDFLTHDLSRIANHRMRSGVAMTKVAFVPGGTKGVGGTRDDAQRDIHLG
ncbi:hypothetical protein [Sphingomonas oryzagri]